MASELKNLSVTEGTVVPSAEGMKFGIIYSEWNNEITGALKNGAIETLLKNGAKKEDIFIESVPGSFELTLGAKLLAEEFKPDAILALGCVIQGETRHFDFICDAVAKGITDLNIQLNIPVIFGILTPDNMQQAIDRAGGKHGNKGDEAAITAIKMIELKRRIKKERKSIGF